MRQTATSAGCAFASAERGQPVAHTRFDRPKGRFL